MLIIVVAIAGGILIGLAFGGSFRKLSEVHFRWWPLALVGLALQLIPVPSLSGQLDHWIGVGLLLASYAVLVVFVAANIRVPGFALIAVGFALNFVVIAVNGGMPVDDSALRSAYGPQYAETKHELVTSGSEKHHLRRPDDVLIPIADVVPVGAPVRKVFSPGDLIALVGVAWVMASATRGAGRERDAERATTPRPAA